MEEHLVELEELFDRLASAGQKMETSLKVAMIYRSLPESYGGLVTAMESRPDADQTLEFVKQKLLDEHLRRAERSGESEEKALLMRNGRNRVAQPKWRERVCYHCRKPGHIRRDCWVLKKEQEEEEKEELSDKRGGRKAKMAVESPICFTVGSDRRSDSWYMDSGCTNHMTNDESFFRKFDNSVPSDVVLADGTVAKSVGIGEGNLMCVDNDGRVRDITIKDMLLVPNLDCNLLSVRRMAQKGLCVNFDASKCSVKNPDGRVVAVAELSEGLYRMNVVKDAKLPKEVREESCQFVRHWRFGNRGPEQRDSLMDGSKVQEEQAMQEESGDVFFDCNDC